MKKNAAPLLALLVMVALLSSCKKFFERRVPKVDAGHDIVTALPKDSVLLSGSATDKDGVIKSYLWLKLEGPGTPDIEHADSASTWVRNLAEGVYKFKLVATDDDGIFGSDTVSVTVASGMLSAQPSNNEWEIHLFGNSNGIDQTDRHATEIAGGSGTYLGDPVNIRALLKFDLSSIPENAEIVSANLFLYSHPDPLNGQDQYPNYGTENALLIQRVSEVWDNQHITWANQPSGITEGQITVPQTNEHSLDLNVDVKELISTMVEEGNNGFLIKLQNEVPFNWRIFVSSKNADATKHPKLEVVYRMH